MTALCRITTMNIYECKTLILNTKIKRGDQKDNKETNDEELSKIEIIQVICFLNTA